MKGAVQPPTLAPPEEHVVAVLAHPLRAAIVRALAGESLCTCHLVELTGARQTNVSNHLRALREAGVVEAEPAGRYTYYRLRPDVLDRLAGHFRDLASQARSTAGALSVAPTRRPCG